MATYANCLAVSIITGDIGIADVGKQLTFGDTMQTNGRQGNQQGNQLIILTTVKGQLNIQYTTISKCICMTFLFCVTYLSLLAPKC